MSWPLISVATNGQSRPDVDPVQLRWAGVPRSRAFEPMDLRRDQREYLNVLCLANGSRAEREATGPPAHHLAEAHQIDHLIHLGTGDAAGLGDCQKVVSTGTAAPGRWWPAPT